MRATSARGTALLGKERVRLCTSLAFLQYSCFKYYKDCLTLQELPEPTPVKTRLPPEIFGDALMVLEFLHAFGELFDLQDEFPEGVSLGKYSITCCRLEAPV